MSHQTRRLSRGVYCRRDQFKADASALVMPVAVPDFPFVPNPAYIAGPTVRIDETTRPFHTTSTRRSTWRRFASRAAGGKPGDPRWTGSVKAPFHSRRHELRVHQPRPHLVASLYAQHLRNGDQRAGRDQRGGNRPRARVFELDLATGDGRMRRLVLTVLANSYDTETSVAQRWAA